VADKVNWGILGTGNIARTLAKAINESKTGRLLAVASRTQENADRFGKEFGAERCYGSYQALLDDRDVRAVYISLPNHLHAEWTVKCAEAGKAILCEKPLATNIHESMVMMEAVRRAGVFFMEAFMYRCHPQTARLVELLRQRVIGDVRLIQAQFSYNLGPKYENIRLSNEAAGGGIMDVGCYTVSMARLLAGAATGKDFADPVGLKAFGHIGQRSRVDEWAGATLLFPGDIIAACICGCQVAVDSTLRIWGSEGNIIVPAPWFPSWGPGQSRITVTRAGQQPEEIVITTDRGLYAIEVDTVAACLDRREAPPPCMTWADSMGNMKTLDRWRREAGVGFDREKDYFWPPAFTPGRRLAPLPGNAMKFGKIPGIDKPVSRIVLGTMSHVVGSPAAACAMLDAFVEMGGNCLDGAWIYGTEALVGRWLASRGVRDQLVLIGKGAHPPDVSPKGLTDQLMQSLERLGVDYLDIFLLHRDNPQIPVGEFIDCLNEHQRAGRFRVFGASNWTTARIDDANDYARRKGLSGFVVNSPNLALARWNEPMWPGCVSAFDAESRRWHGRTQMPLLAWSSQANGFLSGAFGPQDSANPALRDVVRVWFNDENFKRLERLKEMAARKGAAPVQLAVAWVLCQPFPTFALVGPQTIDEMRQSVEAVQFALTDDEMRWLEGAQ